jgi:hypothetical protein
MEYVWGALGATFLAGAGALIWYVVRRWGKNEDRAHEIDAARDALVAKATEDHARLSADLEHAVDEIEKAHEALRLATVERDALRRELERLKEQRDRLLHAAAAADPAALGDAVREQLRSLKALRDVPHVPDTGAHDGDREGAVHGPATGKSP